MSTRFNRTYFLAVSLAPRVICLKLPQSDADYKSYIHLIQNDRPIRPTQTYRADVRPER